MGPAEDLSAGFVGVPLPMAIPQTRPPPALRTPQEGIVFRQLYRSSRRRREAPVGSPTEMSEGGPGTRPQHPTSRFPPANIVALRMQAPPLVLRAPALAFLGPAQTDGRDVAPRANGHVGPRWGLGHRGGPPGAVSRGSLAITRSRRQGLKVRAHMSRQTDRKPNHKLPASDPPTPKRKSLIWACPGALPPIPL